MKELVQAVKQWGSNKGLDKVGHLAQAKYTLKETAELLDAYADSGIDAINDAVGDILVTLIVGASNDSVFYDNFKNLIISENSGYRPVNQMFFSHLYSELTVNIFQLEHSIKSGVILDIPYKHCYYSLFEILGWANFNFNQSLSLKDCLQLAYNEIKDRTGHTDENGHFIKDN